MADTRGRCRGLVMGHLMVALVVAAVVAGVAVVAVVATRARGGQKASPAAGSLLSAGTMSALGEYWGGFWSRDDRPAQAASPEQKAFAGDLKRLLNRRLLAAVQAKWLPNDLEEGLVFLPRGKYLAAVERSCLWDRYETAGVRGLVIGRWTYVSAALVPRRRDRLLKVCGKYSSPDLGHVTEWPKAPDELKEALRGLRNQYLRVASSDPAKWRVVRFCGFPGEVGRLRYTDPRTRLQQVAGCLLFCDGTAVGLLIHKTGGLGLWSDPPLLYFEPTPTPAAAKPLNPDYVQLCETGLYRDAYGQWVDDPAGAARAVVQVVLKDSGSSVLPAGAAAWYVVPLHGGKVPAEAWQACESHFLCQCVIRTRARLMGWAVTWLHVGSEDAFDREAKKAWVHDALAWVDDAIPVWKHLKFARSAEADARALGGVLDQDRDLLQKAMAPEDEEGLARLSAKCMPTLGQRGALHRSLTSLVRRVHAVALDCNPVSYRWEDSPLLSLFPRPQTRRPS